MSAPTTVTPIARIATPTAADGRRQGDPVAMPVLHPRPPWQDGAAAR
jgi:hypothetical protein